MSPMHICYLSMEYPPETGWGGIGSYTYEMAHGLVRAGHRVSVIALAQGAESVVDDAGVEVHRVLPAPHWQRLRGLWRLNRVWLGFAWAAMQRFRTIHRRHKVTLIEAPEFGAASLFIGLLPVRPALVVRLHTARVFVDRINQAVPNVQLRLIYAQERIAMQQADRLTSPSKAMVELTATWLPLDRRNVAVIPNPIDTTAFAGSAGRRKLEALYVGRLERRKGVDTLGRATPAVLSRLDQACLRLVGRDGVDQHGHSWRETILALAPPALHRRIHFDHLPRAQLTRAYAETTTAVLPSHWENFPYTALEAMASGAPVIATDTGGYPEMIEPGVDGLLVPVGDAQALGDAMYTLLADQEQAAIMGRNARAKAVERFDTGLIIPQMLKLYSSVKARRRQ